jgi:peptidoglycan/LPS O-acetylase OafA/YrhL
MTDAEWTSWQSSWTGASGPLPDVRARTRKEVRVHRLANLTFFVLIAGTLALALPSMMAAPEPEVRWIGVLVVGFFAAMSIGYLLIQRGIALANTGNPREALAFLERRLRVERLTAHLVRWVYAVLCIAFLFIFPQLVAQHEKPWLEKAITYPCMALVFVVTFTSPWWVARRNRKHQQEIDRWRRWMDEQHL